MQTEEIKVELPSDLAERFRNATPEQQRKALGGILQAVEETIRYTLMSGEEAAREFQQLSQRMGAYAAEQGLAEEKLEALLRDDDA